jgi:alkyl sulfatase BDS1-like metallo-beta-lactamase superfamily hydrolase
VEVPGSVLAALVLAIACGRQESPPRGGSSRAAAVPDAQGHTAPSPFTVAANAAVAKALPLDDPQDFEDVHRGLVASDPDVLVTGEEGRQIWDTRAYAFVTGDAPASVNPSLWRQAKLNGVHGLFEVVPGIHQARGYDISNMTVIQGKTGWIVVDPLASRETGAAAFALARRQLGEQPVVAVIPRTS